MRSHSRVKKPVRMAAAPARHRTGTSATGAFRSRLYKRLIVLLPPPYVLRRLLNARRFSRRNALASRQTPRRDDPIMHLTVLHYVFLIPVGLALAFMLWVLWSLTRQLSNHRVPSQKQPMISICVVDRYSLGAQAARSRNRESRSRPAGDFSPPSRHLAPPAREFSRVTSPPTLGMSARRMSGSANPAVPK